MSDEKAFASVVSKALNLPSAQPGLTPEAKRQFQESLQARLAKDIRAQSLLNPLLKSDQTFDRSLGDIYLFLEDRKICAACPESLSSCPKEAQGYRQTPTYDADKDQIVLVPQPCPYLKEKIKRIANIWPAVSQSYAVYNDASRFLLTLRERKNRDQLADSAKALKAILSLQSGWDKKAVQPGLAFYSINGFSLSHSLLATVTLLFASSGVKVGFLSMPMLFNDLSDFSYESQQLARNMLAEAAQLPVLCLDDFTLPTRKMPQDALIKDLLPFIRSRNCPGKLTFFSMSQDKTPVTIASTLYRGLDQQGLVLEAFRDIAKKLTIKDLPL
jgi:hypothetical protein